MKIRINKRFLATEKPIGLKKIVNFSDAHIRKDNYLKKVYDLIPILEDIQPDVICIPGDFVDTFDDTIADRHEILEIVRKISSIAHTVMSLGSHDYYSNIETNLRDRLLNVYFKQLQAIGGKFHVCLPNDPVTYHLDDNFVAGGFSIPISEKDSLENGTDLVELINPFVKKLNFDEKDYNMLLCHSPISFFDGFKMKSQEEMGTKFVNLVLSGHNHAALTPKCFEFLKLGIISPDKHILVKCPSGVFTSKTDEDYNIDISRGFLKMPGRVIGEFGSLGNAVYAVNNLYRPDIELITLQGKDKVKQFTVR